MLVVVGGHSRNVGKTSVVCEIISGIPEAGWQAIKITQHGHSFCSIDGLPCDCAPGDASHPFVLDEESRAGGTDSGRYLAAGARRSFWLRTAKGELGHAIPTLKSLIAGAAHSVLESNSVMRFLTPDLYIVVLDYGVEDMKESTRLYFDRADAFVVNAAGRSTPPWPGIPRRWLEDKPWFPARPPLYGGPELIAFVRSRMSRAPALAECSGEPS
ncbi:MAG: hypothetical protein IANPNBLG_00541 [Bryobacteraceae bacterium]|nr:hypothetical protein [Bryobacteraceae bacterium]